MTKKKVTKRKKADPSGRLSDKDIKYGSGRLSDKDKKRRTKRK